MPMTISYDSAVDAWTLRCQDVHVRNEAELNAWYSELVKLVSSAAKDKKISLLIDITEFDLDPRMGREYGAKAKEVVTKHTTFNIRYGGQKGLSQSSIQLQGLIHHYTANIYADRATALTVLQEIRKQQKVA